MLKKSQALCLAIFAGMCLSAATVAAQNVCIPNAVGVPFLSGPPNWFNAALPQPQFWPDVDDPRWRGAFLRTFGGAAASEHVAYRALRDATSLYLQWNVTVDPQLDELDELWVAFSPGPGQDDVLIQIVPFANSNTNVSPPVAAASVQVLTRTPGAAFAPLAAVPAWLQAATTQTRVMRVVGDGRWAVLMRVPIVAPPNGINLANTFKMWSGTMVSHAAGVVEYNYPEAVDLTNVLASTNNTGWSDVRRDVAPTDASCIRGVSIVSSDIGTEANGTQCTAAGPLSTSINLTLPGPVLGSTTLCARPLNETGGNIPANDIQATFRNANWGTQPTAAQAITTAWTRVNSTPATNTAAIGNNAKGALEFDWLMTRNDGTVNDVCTFTPQPNGIVCNPLPPVPRWIHQCMLVELGGAPGITFPVSSVAQNMNFVSASRFEREAEVSVRGLQPAPGAPPQRDVYLYVQTNNMPAQVNGNPRPRARPTPNPSSGGFFAPKPGGGSGGASTSKPGGTPAPKPGAPPAKPVPPAGPSVVRDATVSVNQSPDVEIEPLPKSQYEQLRETAPTYQVHGFHDTGRTITLRGRPFKVLEPQSSFGYFVDHTGTLLGWRHELEGAEKIAPNYYHLGVDNGGAARVTTIIEAIDSRWSVSLHGGLAMPVGDFADSCDSGFSLGVDAEYRITGMVAAEAFYGNDRFDCADDTTTLNHFEVNGKLYFGQVVEAVRRRRYRAL